MISAFSHFPKQRYSFYANDTTLLKPILTPADSVEFQSDINIIDT